MNTLAIGKLYVCPDYHLLVFPTEERALAPRAQRTVACRAAISAATAAYYWSEKLNCHVSWIPAGRVFCAVEEMGGETHGYRQVHVIAGEAVGWISVPKNNWTNIKEMAA